MYIKYELEGVDFLCFRGLIFFYGGGDFFFRSHEGKVIIFFALMKGSL